MVDDAKKGLNTRLARIGNEPFDCFGFINPPVVRGSTVLFPDSATMDARAQDYTYGTHGTPTTNALCNALNELENADGTVLMPSGLAAITISLLVFARAGGHVLIVDSLYSPTRAFCNGVLKKLGMEIEYFSAGIDGEDFGSLIKDNTCILMLECPASNSFEMIDAPLLARIAHQKNPDCVVMMDNTWATPLFFKPLKHGIDISIQALTKYASGHSDVLMGSASATTKHFATLKQGYKQMGICVSSDDTYLVLRGLRTMNLRLQHQQTSTMEIIKWLQQHEKVARVLYPALPSHPGHHIWQRYFSGASGLFSFVLKDVSRADAAKFLDALELHGLGFSWAGYESLAVLPDFADRTKDLAPEGGATIRIQVGLEDVADIIADLEKGLSAVGFKAV